MAHPIYRLKDGTRVSSVTTIIGGNLGWGKQPLILWANRMGLEGKTTHDILQDAATAGSIAHGWIEQNIKDEPVVYPEPPNDNQVKAIQSYENYLKWKDSHKFKLIETEISMVSEQYRYGGTCDCIALIDDTIALFDWKTSNSCHEDYLIQLAAYGHLLKENNLYDPREYHLLRIDKETGAYAHFYWQDLSKGWEAFLALLKLNELKKELKI